MTPFSSGFRPGFGRNPLDIIPREDPGYDVIGTTSWITAQVFGSAGPHNMETARLTADGYSRTLDAIQNLPTR